MLNTIKRYLLKQEINSISKIQKQFVEWDRIQSAAVLVGSSKYSMVKDFVRQSNKNFDVIVYHDDKIAVNKDCFLSVNKKDFNFFDLPRPDAAKRIKNKTYDVLISTDFNNTAAIKTLTGLFPAKCKLGPESAYYSEFFDIRIESSESEFLKQAQKYLMMIKS